MKNELVRNHWQIAWKRKNEEKYKFICNPKWGWCADPFLVEYENELYLFAEIFLYKSERNGVIGYCKYLDGVWGDWVVTMDKHWHLSYPNVWVEDGKLLMCPESYQMEEVAIYELVEFPNKWKKINTLISDVEYCDTTFLCKDGNKYMITYERGTARYSGGRGLLYRILNGRAVDMQVISESNEGNRCGGKIITEQNRIIRVAQNCKEEYGGGLIFYEIESVSPIYVEHEVKRILPKDIFLDGKNKFTGIHTYNTFRNIEVIDLKYSKISIDEYFARQRIKKVFVNKYV